MRHRQGQMVKGQGHMSHMSTKHQIYAAFKRLLIVEIYPSYKKSTSPDRTVRSDV